MKPECRYFICTHEIDDIMKKYIIEINKKPSTKSTKILKN